MNIFTHNEAVAYILDGSLPSDLADRLKNFIEFETCSNCDGVRCMHFVMRDWWAEDFDDCDGWCCPFCSLLKPEDEQLAFDSTVDAHREILSASLAYARDGIHTE